MLSRPINGIVTPNEVVTPRLKNTGLPGRLVGCFSCELGQSFGHWNFVGVATFAVQTLHLRAVGP